MPLAERVEAPAGGSTMKDNVLTKESVQQIAVEFLKKRKCTDRVDVSAIEKENEIWVIRGTCPLDLEGHPWAEKFEVVLDTKGKIKSTSFALL
jgi:hypothetical protein